MFFFTADPHMDFKYIEDFAADNGLSEDDVVVILGDACLNHYLDERDLDLKKKIAENVPCQLFIVRGNHDARCSHISSYEEKIVFDGIAYVEPDFPRFIFARDGEFYNLEGIKTLAIGGAYTANPQKHINQGHPVHPDEMLSEEERQEIEWKLEDAGWKAELVLTHSCPQRFIIPQMLHPGYDQALIDHSNELWLDVIEECLDYKTWLFGHFHQDQDLQNGRAMCLRWRIKPLSDIATWKHS